MSKLDYLIIGHGVVGAVLAHQLLDAGKSVMVVDSPKPNTSSEVAAGILNPVTGKRLTLTWKAHDFFPEAMRYYKWLEKRLDTTLYHSLPLHRVFKSLPDQNDWMAKQRDTRYAPFVEEGSVSELDEEHMINPFGTLKVNNGGRVNVKELIKYSREYLERINSFRVDEVSLADVEVDGSHITCNSIEANHIIFCTGLDEENWGFLPFTPMKGEVLQVESTYPRRDEIVIGGCFFCPTDDGLNYAGATYNWRDVNLERTEEGKTEILDKLASFLRHPVRVKEHKAGIRPAVKDRRPLIGKHPVHKRVYLCSGMGSKGVSMAPYLCKHLIEHIELGKPLMPEVDLKRYT